MVLLNAPTPARVSCALMRVAPRRAVQSRRESEIIPPVDSIDSCKQAVALESERTRAKTTQIWLPVLQQRLMGEEKQICPR